MGTSKGYSTPKWPGVNSAIGNAVSSGYISNPKLANAVNNFTQAYQYYLKNSGSLSRKGGRGASSGSAARSRAASSGSQLAHFIATSNRTGLDSALKEFGLTDIKDKPLGEFLDLISDRLSGNGALLDENAIKYAMADTLDELTEEIDSVAEFEELLSSNNINIAQVLQIFYANFLAANFEQKEYSHVRKKISRENTERFFKQAHNLIRSIVREELSQEKSLETIDWNSREGQQIADEINQEVLEILLS